MKKVKDKTKDEILTDLLNHHVSKGNIKVEQVKDKSRLLKQEATDRG